MKNIMLFALAILITGFAVAQNNIGIGTLTPDKSSILDISSTTKGMLVPRMKTAERNLVATPAKGLLVFDTDTNGFWYYNGSTWVNINSSADTVFVNSGGAIHNTGNISTDNFVVGKTNLPDESVGLTTETMLFFNKQKGAMRAGIISETNNWSPSSIGYGSVAFGENTQASAKYSVAMGISTEASGYASTALGYKSYAKGDGSFAAGIANTASGLNSFVGGKSSTATGTYGMALGLQCTASGTATVAAGQYSTASGNYSVTLGSSNLALGDYSNVIGNNNVAAGYGSTAMGVLNTARGTQSFVCGIDNVSRGLGSMVIGMYNDSIASAVPTQDLPANPLFIIGNGSSQGRHNALAVLKNGNVGIGVHPTDVARLAVSYNSDGAHPQLLLEEQQDDYARLKMKNTASDAFWDIAAKPSPNTANAFYSLWFNNASTTVKKLELNGNGNLWIAGTLTQNSDERLKKNITTLTDPLEELQQLNGYHYNWKDANRDSSLQTGLLAQQVEAVMPELVTTDNEGIKSVNYIGLIPYLVEAVKTLHAKNEALEKKLQQINGTR